MVGQVGPYQCTRAHVDRLGWGNKHFICSFVGAIGEDAAGQAFKVHLEQNGITPHLQQVPGKCSAVCCCLIADDGQRTMFTCLGASEDFSPTALPLSMIPSLNLVHCEGYMLCKTEVLMTAALATRDSEAIFSLDLASFEVIRNCEAALKQVLSSKSVDVVFCNEDEAQVICELFGEDTPGTLLLFIFAHSHTCLYL